MRPIPALWPLSVLYGAGVGVRNRLYDLGAFSAKDISKPVISVGNITAGGTGKSPFILLLIARLKQLKPIKGLKLGVVSRGYGGTARSTTIVSDGRRVLGDPFSAGDEPVMIAEASRDVVVIVDANRILGAEMAIDAFKCNCILLDDGFQHRRLARNLDIVLLDGKNPLGNRMMLPAGYLREPVSSLRRAGVVALSKCNGSDDEIASRCLKLGELLCKPVIATRFVPKYWRRVGRAELFDAQEVKDKKVYAFAGIARPGSFFDTVATLGADIAAELPLPDHCSYSKFYLDKIARDFVRSGAEWLVTTAKDAVKLPPILKLLPVHYLEAEHQIVSGQEILDNALLEAVQPTERRQK